MMSVVIVDTHETFRVCCFSFFSSPCQLEFYFQNKPNTYTLFSLFLLTCCKSIVTFTTPDPEKLPIPSQTYLEIHAACCRVANLLGAGKCIDTILRDMEDIQVLSQDGASAEALQYALWPLSQEISVY